MAAALSDAERAGRRRCRCRCAGRRRVPRALRRPRRRRPTTSTTTSSPTRCCGSSSTTSGTSAAPDIRREEMDAWENGYLRGERAVRRRRVRPGAGRRTRTRGSVMLHDYQLYSVAPGVRAAAPGRLPALFVHIPWPQSDYWRVLPAAHPRGRLPRACSATTSSPSTRGTTRATSCTAATTCSTCGWTTSAAGALGGPRRVGARLPGLEHRPRRSSAGRCAARWPTEERPILRRRRELPARARRPPRPQQEHHPRLRRVRPLPRPAPRVQGAHHVPGPAAAVARGRRGVRRVPAKIRERGEPRQHAHGTTDWMPIDLRIQDDFPGPWPPTRTTTCCWSTPIFDGMNLVAKEGPILNQRDGVLILSEYAGAYEELGAFAIAVNPFDIESRPRRCTRRSRCPPTSARRAPADQADRAREQRREVGRRRSSPTSPPSSPTGAAARGPARERAGGDGEGGDLTHLDERGQARMVGVGPQAAVQARRAVAEALVRMSPGAARAIVEGAVPKGDVGAVARVAGIMAAKRTAELIALCHPLPIDRVDVEVEVDAGGRRGDPAGRGRDQRPHRRRDGGAHRGRGRRPHRVRHGEGRRPGREHRARAAAGEDEGRPGRRTFETP